MSAVKKIPVGELSPQTFYDVPLWLDEDFLLLTKESPITESLIKILKEWGYKEVIAKNSAVKVSSSTVESKNNESVFSFEVEGDESLEKAKEFYKYLVEFTHDVYTEFSEKLHLDIKNVTEKVKELIEMIRQSKDSMIRFSEMNISSISYIINSTVRTTIIAIVIGATLKLPQFRLIELGIAGLLHKVGMMKIPDQIVRKKAPLTDSEKKFIALYPSLGMKMLEEFSRKTNQVIAPEILIGIGLHKKRENRSGSAQGQGQGRKGITQIGKILIVGSIYNARISHRSYREGLDAATSMVLMLKDMRNEFDEKIVAALLSSFSLYPPGTYVSLDNGMIGITVEVGKESLKTPVVKVLLDGNLNVLREPLVVKTQEEEGISVKGVLTDMQFAQMKI